MIQSQYKEVIDFAIPMMDTTREYLHPQDSREPQDYPVPHDYPRPRGQQSRVYEFRRRSHVDNVQDIWRKYGWVPPTEVRKDFRSTLRTTSHLVAAHYC